MIYSTFNLLNIYNAIASLFLIHIPFDIFGEEDEVVVEVYLRHFNHVFGYAEIGFGNAACDCGDRIRITADGDCVADSIFKVPTFKKADYSLRNCTLTAFVKSICL